MNVTFHGRVYRVETEEETIALWFWINEQAA